MLYYEGLTCPVCNKRFEEGEDIVTCPHCGLPHHRSCWMQENRCHDAENHGTEKQWSRDKAVQQEQERYTAPEGQPSNAQICPYCYTKNYEYAEFCSHCGRSLNTTEWHSTSTSAHTYSPFSFDATVPMSEEEKEWSAIVGTNAQYYVPRFRNIQSGRGGGWNWAAFFFAPFWLIYRKQYFLGGIMLAIQVIYNVASLLFPLPDVANPAAAEALLAQLPSHPEWVAVLLLSTLILIAKILLGIRGNNLYFYHCKQRIAKAKENAEDLSASEMSSFGGVSAGVTVMFIFLSSMIEMFAMYVIQLM